MTDQGDEVCAALSLLGGWRLDVLPPLSRDIGDGGRRVLALLALRGAATRSQLAGTIWPDVSERAAAARLRTVLWRLSDGRKLIEERFGALRLCATVRVDVDEMRRCALELDADGALGATLSADLFAEDLLPGWYEDWLVIDRERMRQVRLRALESLSRRERRNGHYTAAVDAAFIAIRTDPLRESAHGCVIEAHLADGNLGPAITQFESCRQLLLAELGIEPSAVLYALFPESDVLHRVADQRGA